MFTISRRIKSTTLIIALAFAIGGCANTELIPANETPKQATAHSGANQEKAVMDNFNSLQQKKDVAIPEIIKYIGNNISTVSQPNASTMVNELEKLQKEKLPKLQDKFAEGEVVQQTLARGYKDGVTDSYIDSLDNKEVKELLVETKNSGYKIETAEGMFFPVIDYSSYKKYRNAVSQDIAAFIDIMAIESDKTPVKDAGLMINWAEIIKRAGTQEQFIKEYGNSAKVEDIRQLLKRYAALALYGTNNTPLFNYETKQMAPEAKKTYLETGFDENNGSFSKAMSGYLAILKKNDYKLTNEVQEYRNKAAEEIR